MTHSNGKTGAGVLVLCDGTPACRALVKLLHSLEFDVVTVNQDAFRKRFSPTPKRLSMVDVLIIDLDGSDELYTLCDALMRLDNRPALLLLTDETPLFRTGLSAAPDRVSLMRRPISGRALHTEIEALLAA